MPEASEPRVLKVFLASPGDVKEEREALAELIHEINDVLVYLSPEKRLRLQLVRYETDAYPDIGGGPQGVINRLIPLDYDIFIGAMWRRCGTPTATSPSGTIEEFRRAWEKRQKGRLPRIMFYFCDQPIPIPDAAELEQLTGVVNFRAELNKLGLTWTYPAHGDFRKFVSGGLLRAIRDILDEDARAPQAEVRAPETVLTVDAAVRAEMLQLAAQYDKIRSEMASSGARTRAMTDVVSRMKAKASSAVGLLGEFLNSGSPGARLAAIAILQMFPNPECLDWLAGRLDNPETEAPFIGYQASVALLEAVRALPADACSSLKKALQRANRLGDKLPEDSNRIQVLATAQQEFVKNFSLLSPNPAVGTSSWNVQPETPLSTAWRGSVSSASGPESERQ